MFLAATMATHLPHKVHTVCKILLYKLRVTRHYFLSLPNFGTMIKEFLGDDLYYGMFLSHAHWVNRGPLSVHGVAPHEVLFAIILRYSLTLWCREELELWTGSEVIIR